MFRRFAIALLSAPLSMGLSLSFMPPSPAQVTPSDVRGHWADQCLKQMVHQDIIKPFPDNTFRAYVAMKRGDFADVLSRAFPEMPLVRVFDGDEFVDIPANYQALLDIEYTYETHFLSGYPDRSFKPNEEVSRLEVILAIASGLGLVRVAPPPLPSSPAQPNTNPAPNRNLLEPQAGPFEGDTFELEIGAALQDSETVLQRSFVDVEAIPPYARPAVAAAIEAGLVVNFPYPPILRPQDPASRGDVAAFICQATGSPGLVSPLYQVGGRQPVTPNRFNPFPRRPF
ncbi:MAG: S-layer homology domain-containing protein [Cyanobacteria bacterium P01_G01_bin.54]